MPIYKVNKMYKKLLENPRLVIVYEKRSKTIEIVQKSKNESKYWYLIGKDREFYTLRLVE